MKKISAEDKVPFWQKALTFWGVAAYLIWRYPLNRQTMHEIRSKLETRRGKM
jgi:Na+/melibiose symporter-like transporter